MNEPLNQAASPLPSTPLTLTTTAVIPSIRYAIVLSYLVPYFNEPILISSPLIVSGITRAAYGIVFASLNLASQWIPITYAPSNPAIGL
jgi:hypothetical protein